MSETSMIERSPDPETTVARASEARAAAAALIDQAAAAHERVRTVIASGLALRDVLADVVWATRLDQRNPLLARRLADSRRRYAGMVGRAPEIERAATLVSYRYGCSPSEAFALMRSVSQRTNRKLAVVARSIVDEHERGSPPPAGGVWRPPSRATPSMPTRDLVVIGASAGGITALLEALGDGEPIDAAVLVVLHLPATARTALPDILARRVKTPAELASDGQRLERGRILVAPPNRHLLVGRETVRLSAGPRENRSRPAVDPLFRTAAASHGQRVIAVVLSGALADGAAGMVAVRRSGGFGLVQKPDDAVLPSMPSSALALAGADDVVPARAMRSLIDRLTKEEVPPVEDGPDQPDVVELDVDGLKRAAEDGTLANLTCPECSGSLWEFEEGNVITYRCRVGHAFTADVLVDAQTDGIEDVLWKAVRAQEELASMLSRRADVHQHHGGDAAAADALRRRADLALERAEQVRTQIADARADRGPRGADQL